MNEDFVVEQAKLGEKLVNEDSEDYKLLKEIGNLLDVAMFEKNFDAEKYIAETFYRIEEYLTSKEQHLFHE